MARGADFVDDEVPKKEIAGAISELLVPKGFRRRGHKWRASNSETHRFVQISYLHGAGTFELSFGVWMNSIERPPVERRITAGIFGTCHLFGKLGNFLPPELSSRYNRATNFHADFPVWAMENLLFGDEEIDKYVREAYENPTPMPIEERFEVFKLCFVSYGLPFLQQLETDQSVFDLMRTPDQCYAVDERVLELFGIELEKYAKDPRNYHLDILVRE